MSQVSYGTITIVDTNDIESITIEYAQNQDSSNPPSSGWDTVRPTWRQNYFIWQRTRIHKSGTTADKDSFGAAVCLTGSTGATGSTGQSLSTTKTQYTHVTSNVTITTSNHTSYTWTDNVPEYDSTKPVYWGRITNTYINPAKTEYIIYKDNGLTEAIAKSVEANDNASDALDKANEANSIAAHANENAQGAISISRATQQHFWFNSTTSGSIEAGAYITDTAIDTFKSGKNGGYLLARSDGVELGRGTNKFMTLSATALNFYRPGTSTIDATLTSKGLVLSKGGIEAGTKNTTNYIYIYSDDDATNHKLTINSHEASDWRIVAGKNFGVDKAGNLYASGANIEGKVTITSGSNVYTKIEADAAYDAKGAASTVQTNLDNLEIGGRNLYAYGSDLQTSLSGLTNYNNGFSITTEDGFKCAHATGALTTTKYLMSKIGYVPKPLETFTYSCFVKLKNIVRGTTSPMCEFYFGGQSIGGSWKGMTSYKAYVDGEHVTDGQVAFDRFISDANWHHCAVVGTYANADFTATMFPSVYLRDCTGDLYVHHVKVERGNKATDWTPAPEDIEAAAVAEEQYIYISKASGTTSVDGTTSWVTKNEDKQNVWTTKRPTYDSSYPVLFVAKQKKVVDGTVTCTTPLKDDTTTVIDGGHITTGTIDASKATITNINGANIKAGTLSIGKIDTDDQDKILNSNIQIGGENLLQQFLIYNNPTAYQAYRIPLTENFIIGETYTLQLWGVTFNNTPAGGTIAAYWGGGSIALTGAMTPNSDGYMATTFTITQAMANKNVHDSKRWFISIYNSTPSDSKTSRNMTLTRWKLEKGNKATDWSLSSADTKGGVNLLRCTAEMNVGSGAWAAGHFRASGGTVSHVSATSPHPDGVSGATRVTNTGSSATSIGLAQSSVPNLITNKLYTLSGWIRASAASLTIGFQPIWQSSTQTTGRINVGETDTGWSYYSATLRLTGDQATTYSAGYIYVDNVPANGWFEVCGLKLEEGPIATGWSLGDEADASNYISASSSGIRIASANPATQSQRMELTNSELSMYSSDNKKRVSITSGTGVVVGLDSTGHSVINDDGLHVYNGTHVNHPENEVASFGATARIGAKVASSSYLTLAPNKMALVGTNSSNTPSEIFIVGNLLNETDIDSYVGNGSKKEFLLSTNFPSSDPPNLVVKVNNVTKTKGTDYTHTYKNSRSYIIFTTAPAADADIEISYTITHSSPYATFYNRKDGSTNKAGSFVFGKNCEASANFSHAFGVNSSATYYGASADGYYVTASGQYSHAEGNETTASGSYSHAEGYNTAAEYFACHAEGQQTTARNPASHAEGYKTTASGSMSHAEGYDTKASNSMSHAEGCETTASGSMSHAEGYSTTASNNASHAEGYNTKASGVDSHAEGSSTTASDHASHAEGDATTASGWGSHAEGYETTANIRSSHAEGRQTTASGVESHAEGYYTEASGAYSHAQGIHTIAQAQGQTAIGKYNVAQGTPDSLGTTNSIVDSDYAFIIGNGTENARSNAFAVTWGGDVESTGKRNTLHHDTEDVYLVAKRDDTDVSVGVGVGTGGTNHGLYSFKTNKWIVYNASDGYTYTGIHLNPGTTSTSTSTGFYLGLDAHRWRQLYSYSAPNVKSDKKDKDIVGDLEYAKEFIMGLKPIEFQWKGSDHKRIHMGFIAQDVAEAGKKLDKDLSVYEAHYKDREDDYYGGEETDDEKLSWSMMYEELIAPMVKVIQNQEERIAKLESLLKK